MKCKFEDNKIVLEPENKNEENYLFTASSNKCLVIDTYGFFDRTQEHVAFKFKNPQDKDELEFRLRCILNPKFLEEFLVYAYQKNKDEPLEKRAL